MKDDFEVVSVDRLNIVLKNKDGVKLSIKDGTVLTQINATRIDKLIDFTIPHQLSNGVTIDKIALEDCFGFFGKIVISDGITEIATNSFEMADIDEIVWPSTCPVIPEFCFDSSKLRKFQGLKRCVKFKLVHLIIQISLRLTDVLKRQQ